MLVLINIKKQIPYCSIKSKLGNVAPAKKKATKKKERKKATNCRFDLSSC